MTFSCSLPLPSSSDVRGVLDLFEFMELKMGDAVVMGVVVAVDGDEAPRALLLVALGIAKRKE